MQHICRGAYAFKDLAEFPKREEAFLLLFHCRMPF
jgi:hypothetical protein